MGLIFSVSLLNIGAQEVEIPVSSKDSTEVVQTIKLKFEKPRASNVNVRYQNVLESLTEEQINRIIITLEEKGDASIEMFIAMGEAMINLSSILEEKAFMENKVIYQANEHYNLSESEVKQSLRKEQILRLGTYILILICFVSSIWRSRASDVYVNGFIIFDRLASIMLLFLLEAFALWYILLPAVSIVLNRDHEIIKFLLQGT